MAEVTKKGDEVAAVNSEAAAVANEPKKDAVVAAPSGPTNKELKELKKKEKAAKRAAAKAAQGAAATQSGATGSGAPGAGAGAGVSAAAMDHSKTQSKSNIKKQLNQTRIRETQKVAPLFSHLETLEQRLASSTVLAGIVHPSVLSLGAKYTSYKIVGSTPRCRAMLKCFKEVISSYSTPAGTTLTRNLTTNLSHQIEYLKTARPLSVTMGNSIRWLKQEISLIPIDMGDEEAKQELCDKIDQYIKEKIDLSHDVIISEASQHIQDDTTILTYGHSEVLEKLFLTNAVDLKKNFTVIIVDSRPLFEGKQLAKNLTKKGVKCQYVLINALSAVISDVDYIMLGAHAMLSNGRLYARVGTALIAMSANSRNLPVLVLCESMKFSDKVQLDSVTLNELADADDLVHIDSKPISKKGFALKEYLRSKEAESESNSAQQNQQQKQQQQKQQQQAKQKAQQGGGSEAMDFSSGAKAKELPLHDWKQVPNLNILNLMYDLTPPEYIKKIITEVGALPPSSVPVILREYKNA